ncbi:MAG: hypothetical protein K6V97_15510 [Actinomycetia bacterium]|nr:hypothetical protein [Actinomycetes bacterium]
MTRTWRWILRVAGGGLCAMALASVAGYRGSPLAAARAAPAVGPQAQPMAAVPYPWGQVLLLQTPEGPRTALVLRQGVLWRAVGATVFSPSHAPLQTVGWMSYAGAAGQATVLAVVTTDTHIAAIAAGPPGARQVQPLAPRHLVILRWSHQWTLDQLQPVALNAAGRPVAYYGYPPGPIVNGEALRWYRILAESAPT